MYIAKQTSEEITGDCLLNNQVWGKGYFLLEAFAKSWKTPDTFLGQKQFIMFRRCDKYDY